MKYKILVIRFSSLGDVILASAPILNLKIGFPESHICFLTKEKYAPIAKRMYGIDKILTVSDSPGLKELIDLVAGMENQEYDIIIDLQGNFRSYLVRTLLYAGQKTVYAKDRPARLRVVHDKDYSSPIHTIDKYNECIVQLGLFPAAKRPVLTTSRLPRKNSENLQVVVAPQASFPNKEWPIERFIQTALELQRTYAANIIWATTTKNKNTQNPDIKLESGSFTHLVDCPIGQLADIISDAVLCLSNDSGIAHLSSAVGTPVVALFGPTHPALGFAPRGLFDKVVEVDEYCRPCSLHGNKDCFREERFCFTRISTEKVVGEADRIINMSRNHAKALFADRDGTLIVDKPFISNPESIEFENGSIDALKLAQKIGLKIIIISNQSGVARGYFSESDAERFNRVLVEQLEKRGIKTEAVYFCPHYAQGAVANYAKVCNCRKPAAGMAESAARHHNINLRQSYIVGDKLDDYNLGKVIGARSFLVRTGQGRDFVDILSKLCLESEKPICENLLDAVRKIESLEKYSSSKLKLAAPFAHP